jgi:hypothetical protein
MDETEYERRKRALEEIYKADLELVHAAHAARVRSLEALRVSTGGMEAPGPAPAASPPRPGQPAVVRGGRKPDLRTAVDEIFPQLPAVFEKKDVAAALGWTPNRSSLQRVLTDLVIDGWIEFLETSDGRVPSRYKKIEREPSPPPPLPLAGEESKTKTSFLGRVVGRSPLSRLREKRRG